VLFLVPVIILGAVLYARVVRSVGNQVLDEGVQKIREIRDTVDRQLLDLDKIYYLIAMDEDLKPSEIGVSAISQLIAIEKLQWYTATNRRLIDNILFHVHGNEMVWSAQSVYAPGTIAANRFLGDSMSADEVLALLESPLRPSLFTAPVSTGPRGVIVAYLLPTRAGVRRTATVTFLLNTGTIRSIAQVIAGDPDLDLAVHADTGASFSLSRADPARDWLSTSARVPQIAGARAPAAGLIRASDGYYLVARSEKASWTYAGWISHEALLSHSAAERANVVLTFAIVALIGAILIYATLQFAYDPIRRLRKSVEGRLGAALSARDDLEAIRDGFRQLTVQKDEHFRRYVNQNREAVQDYLLLSLLNGRILDLEEFNVKSEQVGLHFSVGNYAAVIVALEGGVAAGDRDMVLKSVQSVLGREYEVAWKPLPDPDKGVYVIGSRDQSETRLQAVLQLTKEYVETTLGYSITLATGSFAGDITQASRSFVEARAALDYRVLLGTSSVIAYGRVARATQDAVYYPEEEMRELRSTIMRGDAQAASETVHAILAALADHAVPLFAARCICYDIINTFIRTMHEMNMDFSSVEDPAAITAELTELHSLEVLDRVTRLLAQQVCNHISRTRHVSAAFPEMIERIEAYVREHYAEITFSLQEVADAMGISQSALSTIYRTMTGNTLHSVVTDLRIEKAKEELRADLPIKKVVVDVGYSDASSFIKKFKREVGMTPGNYARLHRVEPGFGHLIPKKASCASWWISTYSARPIRSSCLV